MNRSAGPRTWRASAVCEDGDTIALTQREFTPVCAACVAPKEQAAAAQSFECEGCGSADACASQNGLFKPMRSACPSPAAEAETSDMRRLRPAVCDGARRRPILLRHLSATRAPGALPVMGPAKGLLARMVGRAA